MQKSSKSNENKENGEKENQESQIHFKALLDVREWSLGDLSVIRESYAFILTFEVVVHNFYVS